MWSWWRREHRFWVGIGFVAIGAIEIASFWFPGRAPAGGDELYFGIPWVLAGAVFLWRHWRREESASAGLGLESSEKNI